MGRGKGIGESRLAAERTESVGGQEKEKSSAGRVVGECEHRRESHWVAISKAARSARR